MKKIITIAIVIIVIIAIFFIKTNYKSLKFGNNISNKSAEEIAQYILDINSYQAQVSITVESNKNTNAYLVKEECVKDNNTFKQEILEPQNLNGISFIYDGIKFFYIIPGINSLYPSEIRSSFWSLFF